MSMTIVCDVGFESAHRLPHVAPGHKCGRLHGHSYRCEIHVRGAVDPHTGWVQDFASLRAAFEPLRQVLDHNTLNEIDGLRNPTSENIARWIWGRLRVSLPALCAVVIHETCTCRCVYTGEGS